MLRILSPLDLVQRVDVKVTDGVLASGYIGSWVTINTASGTRKTTRQGDFASSNYNPVWVIWSEGNKRGATMGSLPSAGFSPDTSQTKRLTTLVGKWRGWTDMVEYGTSTTPGTLLCPSSSANVSGTLQECKLINVSGLAYVPSGLACAVVRDYVSTYVHMGVTYTGVWEIESLY